VFHLTHFDWHAPQPQFDLLNNEQRHAVREFLHLIRDAPEYEFERPLIELALEAYWSK
jgi:hypothetical protein